ncbi:MAG: DUF6290 family protein [Alcaligenaceae bacterium]|nr:DUF6290 family protein [Alcaligenaceae bacterium]
MSIISVRLNPTEERIFTEYATFHGKRLSTLLKECLIEKMEEELDAKLLVEAKEYNKKHTETYTHEQVKQVLGM